MVSQATGQVGLTLHDQVQLALITEIESTRTAVLFATTFAADPATRAQTLVLLGFPAAVLVPVAGFAALGLVTGSGVSAVTTGTFGIALSTGTVTIGTGPPAGAVAFLAGGGYVIIGSTTTLVLSTGGLVAGLSAAGVLAGATVAGTLTASALLSLLAVPAIQTTGSNATIYDKLINATSYQVRTRDTLRRLMRDYGYTRGFPPWEFARGSTLMDFLSATRRRSARLFQHWELYRRLLVGQTNTTIPALRPNAHSGTRFADECGNWLAQSQHQGNAALASLTYLQQQGGIPGRPAPGPGQPPPGGTPFDPTGGPSGQ